MPTIVPPTSNIGNKQLPFPSTSTQVVRGEDLFPEKQNPPSLNKYVVLKFMKFEIQFLREIEQRSNHNLESEYVIPIVGSSQDFDSETWKTQVAEKHPEYKDYPFCVIMPAAGEFETGS